MAHFIDNFLSDDKEQDRQSFIRAWNDQRAKEVIRWEETPKKNDPFAAYRNKPRASTAAKKVPPKAK